MAASLKTCYDVTGLVTDNIPCDPNADVSACCGFGSTCVQNYYCISPYGDKVPGTCTDQIWGVSPEPNPACPCRPHYRLDNTPLNYLDSITLCADGSVCCGIRNNACCDAGEGNPPIAYGNTAVIPSSTAVFSSYYAGVKVTTLPVTRSSNPSGSSTGGRATVTTTVTASADNDTKELSTGAKVGIGMGVAVATLLLIAALVFWMFGRKRYAKVHNPATNETHKMSPPQAIRTQYQAPPFNSHQISEIGHQKEFPSHTQSVHPHPAELGAHSR